MVFIGQPEPLAEGLTERQAAAFESGAADGLEGIRAGLYAGTPEYAGGRAVGERLNKVWSRERHAPPE